MADHGREGGSQPVGLGRTVGRAEHRFQRRDGGGVTDWRRVAALCAAAGVRMLYNDKPVDLAPYIQVDVARLTLE